MTMCCPLCGSEKLFGPSEILCEDESWTYYDCARCHTLLLVVDGELVVKATAW